MKFVKLLGRTRKQNDILIAHNNVIVTACCLTIKLAMFSACTALYLEGVKDCEEPCKSCRVDIDCENTERPGQSKEGEENQCGY